MVDEKLLVVTGTCITIQGWIEGQSTAPETGAHVIRIRRNICSTELRKVIDTHRIIQSEIPERFQLQCNGRDDTIRSLTLLDVFNDRHWVHPSALTYCQQVTVLVALLNIMEVTNDGHAIDRRIERVAIGLFIGARVDIVHPYRKGCPLRQFLVQVHTETEPLEICILNDTLVKIIRCRSKIFSLVFSTAYGYIIICTYAGLEDIVPVVIPRYRCGIGQCGCQDILGLRSRSVCWTAKLSSGSVEARIFAKLAHHHGCACTYHRCTRASALGEDLDHTGVGPTTIDRRGGSTVQYFNALNIRRVDVHHTVRRNRNLSVVVSLRIRNPSRTIAHDHPINDIQWFTGRADGAHTTKPNAHATTGITTVLDDLSTGGFTLQTGQHVWWCRTVDGIALHGCHIVT